MPIQYSKLASASKTEQETILYGLQADIAIQLDALQTVYYALKSNDFSDAPDPAIMNTLLSVIDSLYESSEHLKTAYESYKKAGSGDNE